MVKKTSIVITDDLDGTPGAETVPFSIGGLQYEIDLAPAGKQWLHESLRPFTNAGRRIGQEKPGRRTVSRTDLAEIRAWAQTQGLHVAQRGRICGAVVQQYDATHPRS